MKLLLTAFFAFILTACTSLSEVTISATNAAYVYKISGSSVEQLVTKVDLTDEELLTVVEAMEVFDSLNNKFDQIEPHNILTLGVDYYAAKEAYKNVYNVVVAHESEYTFDEWTAFEDTHEVALQLDEAISEYIDSSNTAESSNMLIQYLVTAAKLAALL